MITEDELARTAERLRDALAAAAEVMAECDSAAATAPVVREHFAMDRNIDRYIDVYHRAIAAGPR